MNSTGNLTRGTRFLLTMACFVIVVAGMKAAGSILIPFLLAIFIAIICTPPLYWLQKIGLPKGAAILVIIIAILAIGVALTGVVGASVNDFSENLPTYRERLVGKTEELTEWLEEKGVEVSDKAVLEKFDPGVAMSMVGRMLTSLTGVLSNAFLILLTVIFMLMEAAGLPNKLRKALDNPEESLSGLGQFTRSVNRYLVLKTAFSIMTGIAVFIWLSILGVDYAVVWGILAFILNYVPNIGSIIAAIPAVLLALVQLSVGSAVLTAAGYLAVNTVFGSILEPRIMGRDLGLSTLVVFLSLVFWGWVLGPVGMLLSVPLTMILRIALESSEDTRGLAILLGPDPGEDGAPQEPAGSDKKDELQSKKKEDKSQFTG